MLSPPPFPLLFILWDVGIKLVLKIILKKAISSIFVSGVLHKGHQASWDLGAQLYYSSLLAAGDQTMYYFISFCIVSAHSVSQ